MKKIWSTILEDRFLFLLFIGLVIFIIFSLKVKGFFSLYNLTNMTQYAVELGLLGLAEMFVIVSGGGSIDLSVGSMMSLSSMVLGILVGKVGVNLYFSIILTLLVGIIMGTINGFLVSYIKIPAFLATLSTLFIYKALALIIAVDPRFGPNPMPVSTFPESFYFVGQYKVGGQIPFQVIFIFIPVLFICHFLLSKTSFGRKIYGVGTNETAALFSGINIKKIRFIAFIFSGFLSALAGWIITSRIASARPDIGSGYELQAITIAVLGGVSITGGEGTVLGVLASILVITLIYNGMQLAGIHQIWQLGALGLILIGSVLLNKLLLQKY